MGTDAEDPVDRDAGGSYTSGVMAATTYSLAEINAMPAADFAAALGEVFEHAPWVAERAAAGRPYASVAALHDSLMQAVHGAPVATQFAFVRGHPELGGKLARAGAMTAASRPSERTSCVVDYSTLDLTHPMHGRSARNPASARTAGNRCAT